MFSTTSRPYGKGRRRRDGGATKLHDGRDSPVVDPSAVGPGGGAAGTILSESVLARSAGTAGRSAAVQVRGFAAATAAGSLAPAVSRFERRTSVPGGEAIVDGASRRAPAASSFDSFGTEEEAPEGDAAVGGFVADVDAGGAVGGGIR